MAELAGFPPRDIALLVIFALMSGAVLVRPWLGVLALAFLSFFHPQGYAQGPVQQYPLVMTMFLITLAAAGKAAVFDQFRPRLTPLLDWRMLMIFALFGWFVITTVYSINHWAAWPYLWDVLKILPALVLVVVLIDTAEKLRALLFVIAISIALVTLKGGYWAVMTGFHDRVYGPPHSQYGDNNEFAVAMVMSLPLLLLILRESSTWRFSVAIICLVALTYIAVISSWSRGGLLAISIMSLLLAVQRARNLVLLAGVSGLIAVILVVLPADWFTRMSTIVSYQGEGSALSRLAVWQLGMEATADRPWLGGGFKSWIYSTLTTGSSMAWHSAYIQILTEHGYVGFLLWSALLGSTVLLGLLAPFRKPRVVNGTLPSMADPRDVQATLALALLGYLVGAVFLSIAYWELVYWLITLAAISADLAGRKVPRGV